MSETLKKLRKERQKTANKGMEYLVASLAKKRRKEDNTTEYNKMLEIQKKVEDLDKRIDKKKEEIRLQQEKELSDIRKMLNYQQKDEETGTIIYEQLLEKMNTLLNKMTSSHNEYNILKLAIQDIEEILRQEHQHLATVTRDVITLGGISARKDYSNKRKDEILKSYKERHPTKESKPY